MRDAPQPVVFEPLFKPKPWGGRRLAELLGKRLPPHVPVGESWELADLPTEQTRVRAGPLVGCTLHDLLLAWGADLLGAAPTRADRFPLLIKFLDAREDLSVQVHPVTLNQGRQTTIKHEAWYVLHADPGARLYAGLQPNVTADQVEQYAGGATLVPLLRSWPAREGDCFYLPAGTVHALGAGTLVAEIQTPSDITYRLYDWERLGLDGRPRELHIESALRNIRYDLAENDIRPTARSVAAPLDGLTGNRVVDCPAFRVDLIGVPAALVGQLPAGELRVWVICSGAARLSFATGTLAVRRGDVVLIPAACAPTVGLSGDCVFLQVTLPGGAG